MASSIIKRRQNDKEWLLHQLRQLQEELKTASATNAASVWTLKGFVAELETANEKMAELHKELAEHDVCIQDERLQFSSGLRPAIGRAQAIIEEARTTSGATAAVSRKAPKLPELGLPAFDGRFEKWPGFRDAFTTLIHENVSIAEVEKFMYLRGCLSGEPASIVHAVPLSDVGYSTAWRLLEEHYENKACLIRAHVDALLDLPLTKRDNQSSLQTLLNALRSNIAALKVLKRPVEQWSDLLVRIIVRRLDAQLQKDWEMCAHKDADGSKVPTYEELFEFLQTRSRQLAATQSNAAPRETGDRYQTHARQVMVTTSVGSCAVCAGSHSTRNCPEFINLTVDQRWQAARDKRMCFNCLRLGHNLPRCPSRSTCRSCGKKHHSVLHSNVTNTTAIINPPVNSVDVVEEEPAIEMSEAQAVNLASQESAVLLSTSLVKLIDSDNREHEVRALLDTGSVVNLITDSCARRLGLKSVGSPIPLSLAGGSQTQSDRLVRTTLKSRTSEYTTDIQAHVLPAITGYVPGRNITTGLARIPNKIVLADPEFNNAAPIELLLGNGVLPKLHADGRIEIEDLVLRNTKLGWILEGRWPGDDTSEAAMATPLPVAHVHISELISQFWAVENHTSPTVEPASKCDKHFASTHTRDPEGRFIVALPFAKSPSELGNSSARAKQAFLAMERRLTRHPAMYVKYREFMREYIDLGHMSATRGDIHTGYYMPHHCILKEASLTTKLRVVFNASAPTSNGTSLNSILQVGPKQQDDLFAVLLRFRCRQFVLSADITKMYRQIWVRPEDRQYQRIWWRDDQTQEMRSYELQTVTYGTAPASYLAIKALREAARSVEDQYPIGARACLKDFYVDDLFTGTDTKEELSKLRREVEAVLLTGGFRLNKWASNCEEVLADISTLHQRDGVIIHEAGNPISALGVQWEPRADSIRYQVDSSLDTPRTKRAMISQICRIFDPLGLLGPIIIIAKILIQELWKLGVGWDEPLPEDAMRRWMTYQQALDGIDRIVIPRKALLAKGSEVELHGFADASESAFGACVYLVTVKANVRVGSMLLCAKSRVAPVKQIEAVLNSRPLTPLSEDPSDLQALTPGHFLIGEALTAPPTSDLEHLPDNRLSRWQLVEKLRQDVWRRWHKEYFVELHQRSKWRSPAVPLSVDQLVVVREDNLPPLQWRLGRVVAVHPGKDGIIRSAAVRVGAGIVDRPVVKLSPLFSEQ
ncbi:uncharacterized protein [Atheta coriaria]|uniref:uncharacterized protein n=1 Tax=Dalotia coriaria TaxID=877792 RepID=UPI0031F37AC1